MAAWPRAVCSLQRSAAALPVKPRYVSFRICADATSHANATYAHTSEYSCRSRNAAFQSVRCESPNAGAKHPLLTAAICAICSASIMQVILVFPENISLIMFNYR